MEDTYKHRNDQYGNGDYAQLDRWSGHITSGYKTSPIDSASLIYTSDYGSYCSQESNHSGTTYSNLVDCEEALHSPPLGVYDIPPPPPEFFHSMERRRDKPLPPPRMASKSPATSKPRIQEPVKAKKISFDDSSMSNGYNSEKEKMNPNDAIPSFATLPRKKKLVNSTSASAAPTPPAAQVTWMKEVAQKGELMHRSKSISAIEPGKQPQSILKKKTEDRGKKGDATGYIKRNTVQRILDQQKKALNRQSAAPATSAQFYKSMPSLHPASNQLENSQSHKAWDWNHNSNENNANLTSTAHVIGVIEPKSKIPANQHVKQNSAETEFEFPPPPTDRDIERIMLSPPVADKLTESETTISRRHNDFTPLILACHNGVISPQDVNGSKASVVRDYGVIDKKQALVKPPVPHRSKKPVITGYQKHHSGNLPEQNNPNSTNTTPVREKLAPPKRTAFHGHRVLQTPEKIKYGNGAVDQPYNPSVAGTDDIVLPPPPEFQETSSPLFTQQSSYGDYELLAPEAQYQCTVHPMPQNVTKTNGYNQTPYHQRIVVDQLQASLADKLKVTEHSSTKPGGPNGYGYYQHGQHNQANQYDSGSSKRNRFVNHRHQYSTEL